LPSPLPSLRGVPIPIPAAARSLPLCRCFRPANLPRGYPR
jgi:hypothetical protein